MPTFRPYLLCRHSIIRGAAATFLSLICFSCLAISTHSAPPNNPVPMVDIVSPMSVTPGSTGVTITIRGTGYVAASVVKWNGTTLTTTFVNGKELTAVVPDAFVSAVGLGTIAVVSPAAGGGTSNIFYIPVASTLTGTNFPAAPSSSISVGTQPTGLVTGDFNGDGKVDLAVANSGNDTVTILLGNGDGTFTAGTPVTAGAGPHWLVTGDFNEDGKLDLAVVNSSSDTVSILLGNGDGTFTLNSSPSTGSGPFAIAAGDFDADGHLDLAVTNTGDGSVSILLGTGTGTFAAGTVSLVGSLPQVLVVGDFNEDGIPDIAVANEGSSTVSVLLGVGDGTFRPQTTFSVGGSGSPIGLIAGDFNGDSHLDVAAVNASDVAILLGNGAGALTLNANPSAGSNLISGVTGDYNGDDKLDIIVADQTAGQAFLFLGNGDGTFGASVTFATASGTYSAATGDFNGDGALDLAFTNNGAANLSIFLQSLPVSLAPASVSFGNQAVGTLSGAIGVTLTNNSGGIVSISSIAIGGTNAGDFSKTTTCGATVAGSGTCSIIMKFMPTATGAEVATLSVTDDAANSPQTLALGGTGVVSPQVIANTFGAAAIPLNGSTSLSFTITNPNSGGSLTSVAFTDGLPAGLVIASPNGLTGSCGGGAITAAAASSSVSLSGATLAAGGLCTFSVNVQGITAGAQNNSVTSTSAEGGTGNTSNASVTVVAPPVLAKSFGAASFPRNGTTVLTFTVSNVNTGSSLTGVGFTDTFPAGLVIKNPIVLAGSCGGGTISATNGNTISLSGGSIVAGGSCTFSVNVTGTTAGTENNVTGNVTSTEGQTGGNASATVKVISQPGIQVVFSPAAIALNATSLLTFTVTTPTANTDALVGVAFSDTLPTGLTVVSSTAAVCGGTLTTTAPTGIVLSDATVAVGGQCQFSISVTGSAPGSYTDATGNVSSTNGGTGNSATDSMTVSAPDLVISKSHAGNFSQGQTGVAYVIAVTNTGSAPTSGTVTVTDALPAGMTATGIAGTGWTCTLGLLTCTRADALSVATAYPSLTLTANVSASAPGSLTNSVSVSGGGEFNTANDTANDVTTINTGASPDFAITSAPATETITAGANATFVLTLRPLNDLPFSSAIALTAVGLPPNATIDMEPATVTPGSSAVTDTLIVKTFGGDSALAGNVDGDADRNIGQRFAQLLAAGIAFSGIPFVGLGFCKKVRLNGKSRVWMVPVIIGFGLIFTGCAGLTRAPGPPPGTFTITVTATSGIVQHSTDVTLTVNP
jgi:uncharacterized repeat protein (TIGR01451 family)